MDDRSFYQPNQPYGGYGREDDPNPSLVPPIETINQKGKMMLHLSDRGSDTVHWQHRYGNPNFLNWLTQHVDLEREHCLSGWTYQNRQTAQEILPFMLLGPMSFARDTHNVQEAGITMMIAVRSKKAAEARPNMMNPARFPSAEGIETATFDVDTPFDMVMGRGKIIRIINDHLEAAYTKSLSSAAGVSGLGKVLVFCETGNERSPVLPVLYLMTVWGLSCTSAVQTVQARRFGIAIDPNTIRMLQNTQDVIKAERAVDGSANPVENTADRSSKKRSVTETYASDEEMQTEAVIDQTMGSREGIAPFTDTRT